MRIYKLNEARNKERFFNRHSKLTPEQKEELIKLYSEQYIPDDIIDWNKIESYSYDDLYNIVNTFIKDREEKKNKKNSSRAIEGRDYIKIFENKNSSGTEYLYLPLTWIGSKYLASDHFLPKIKVPSKVMQARDFSDTSAKNEDLSPGAKWCISLWTIPDWIRNDKPFKTLDGKELRHEGKGYWINYTSGGYYFLFYFRDYNNLGDTNKKVALTLKQGFSKIEDITLADDTKGKITTDIERLQEYWNVHYKEYESQIKHIPEVSMDEYPKFMEDEKQKEQKAIEYFKSHEIDYLFKDEFIYNEATGRYDSKGDTWGYILEYLVKDGEFTVPLGVINGDFDCHNLGLKTLKNGPTKVRGSFKCFHNKLITLEGAPKEIGWDFDCSNNNLTTLEYAPEIIEGDFDCCSNNLTTLEGAPKIVSYSFFCSENHLKSLKGAPNKIGGSFICDRNLLTSLEYSPEYVGIDFDCSYNKLTSLDYAPKRVYGDFWCNDNPLQSEELVATEVGGDIFY